MYSFKNITPTNGFDFENLNNARQNNYAWSMSDLDDYIYVGTGRNIVFGSLYQINQTLIPPISVTPKYVDRFAEIWRYKKDGQLPWKRVFKGDESIPLSGFRFMINHKPFNNRKYLYAAGFGEKLVILKSSNGIDWFPLSDNVLQGTSSRSMLSHKGKLYISTMFDSVSGNTFGDKTLLYSSIDPEYYPWKLVTDSTTDGYIDSLNPKGSITNMAIFNDRFYLATSNSDGVQVWRSNHSEPAINDWTLIVDKGFGDSSNKSCISMGVFKNHLYVTGIKALPLAWAIPYGCDIIRISKDDDWELVVGGDPLIPSIPSKGVRNPSLSGLSSGFNNPFNVYAWQIQQYKDKLFITTFDDSSNMEVILDLLIENNDDFINLIGLKNTNLLISSYTNIINILKKNHYPFGFDLYESEDGINFRPLSLKGLHNTNNYGGRILFVDSNNKLYLGTANPFDGCEVYKAKYSSETNCQPLNYDYDLLKGLQTKINTNFNVIEEILLKIVGFN